MKVRYSKSGADLLKEFLNIVKADDVLAEGQREAILALRGAPPRTNCLLCRAHLAGVPFMHRSVPFVQCAECGQVQTSILPPAGYPHRPMRTVYPPLSNSDFADRVARIYKPKFDWIVEALTDHGYTPDSIRCTPWCEVGCGAGYFLACLKDFGVKQLRGVDADPGMVKATESRLGRGVVTEPGDGLPSGFTGGILAAFFVLEHVADANAFLRGLRSLAPGTVFAFSVPVFGFSCLLESLLPQRYARNLDGVMHTQLYTDQSIDYAMRLAGFEITHEWVFGQDSQDLVRHLLGTNIDALPPGLRDIFRASLGQLVDPLQRSLDKLKLADQRHVLAVRGDA